MQIILQMSNRYIVKHQKKFLQYNYAAYQSKLYLKNRLKRRLLKEIVAMLYPLPHC